MSLDLTVPPSGPGCAECDQNEGWWVHLRRCAECGHVGCCDTSPSQHATAHFTQTGHRLMRSYEPGEDWYWDYVTGQSFDGPELARRSPIPRTSRSWAGEPGAGQLDGAHPLRAGPQPDLDAIESRFVGLLDGSMSRDEVDRWAGRWYTDDELEWDEVSLWALEWLYGIDLTHGRPGDYLDSDEAVAAFLEEFRNRRAGHAET
ncbi:UBP-type zinc finger domain-containing protein [Oerskovia sp. M15]